MSCWATKSPLQVGLILVLIVGVPFLIALIVTYVYFGTRDVPHWEPCSKLCCAIFKGVVIEKQIARNWTEVVIPDDYYDTEAPEGEGEEDMLTEVVEPEAPEPEPEEEEKATKAVPTTEEPATGTVEENGETTKTTTETTTTETTTETTTTTTTETTAAVDSTTTIKATTNLSVLVREQSYYYEVDTPPKANKVPMTYDDDHYYYDEEGIKGDEKKITPPPTKPSTTTKRPQKIWRFRRSVDEECEAVKKLRVSTDPLDPMVEYSHHPAIAALLENLHYDDHEGPKILKCIVPLISFQIALAANHCVENRLSAYSLRVGSNFWSKAGFLKDLVQVRNVVVGGPVLIHFQPITDEELAFRPLFVPHHQPRNRFAEGYSWNSQTWKYRTLRNVEVKMKFCLNLEIDNAFCGLTLEAMRENISYPIVDLSKNVLRGIRVGSHFDESTDQTWDVFLNVSQYSTFLNELVQLTT